MPSRISPTYSQVIEHTRDNLDEFVNHFKYNFRAIRSEVLAYQGISHALTFATNPIRLDYLRAGLLLSDVLQVSYVWPGEMLASPFEGQPVKVCEVSTDKTRFAVEPIEIGDEILLGTGFVTTAGPQFKRLFRYLEPAISSGRLMLTPQGSVITAKKGEPRSRISHAIDPWTPEETWTKQFLAPPPASSEAATPPTPVEELSLEEIVIPFIRGVPMQRFVRILEDEGDRLAKFRAALRSAAIERVKAPHKDIVQDIVRPEVEQLSRRFRQIAQTNYLKIGGTTAVTATLTLVAAKAPWAASLVTPCVGVVGGLGLVFKNFIDYREEKDKLAESPWYPLWRLSKHTR